MLPLGFAIEADGQLLHQVPDFSAANEPQVVIVREGVSRTTQMYRHDASGIQVSHFIDTYSGLDLVAASVQITNLSPRDVTITRIDSASGLLPPDRYTLNYYRSDWGMEFSPTQVPLVGTRVLEVTNGRSTKGMMPWFHLQGASGRSIMGAVAWSGNWIIRFEPDPAGRYRLSAGLSNWMFAKTLHPGESMQSPQFIHVEAEKGDLVDCSLQFARWGRDFAYPHNALSRKMPVEWNHWWPYEDALINEDVFKANSDAAKAMGVEACMLDAGWFGPSEEKSEWYNVRGDWDLVNTRRFPGGLPALGKHVKANGQAFGIWCEIEALGGGAAVARQHPGFVATRDGRPMGYVCMGNPAVRDWAFSTVERLIAEYGAQWIKFDFNLDPGEGCNRTDHGHGPGDGLYEHYMGYYALLDRIRAKYPEVLLENCSSGGLRIDLGMMQHLHATFLSDPDYTEHALQLTWGAATMLHPSAMLRFTWSQCRENQQHNRITDPLSADTPQHKIDYIMRTGMMGILGMSYRLSDLPEQHRERLKFHIAFYKKHIRDLLRDGDFMPLTTQPNRDGTGERWPAFLSLARDKSRAALFVFRMPKSDPSRQIKLRNLDPTTTYTVRLQDKATTLTRTGRQLMEEGLTFESMPEEASEIALITRAD